MPTPAQEMDEYPVRILRTFIAIKMLNKIISLYESKFLKDGIFFIYKKIFYSFIRAS